MQSRSQRRYRIDPMNNSTCDLSDGLENRRVLVPPAGRSGRVVEKISCVLEHRADDGKRERFLLRTDAIEKSRVDAADDVLQQPSSFWIGLNTIAPQPQFRTQCRK